MEENNPMQPTSNEPVGFPGAMPAPSTQPTSNGNWKWLVILILFLIVIGAVTFFVFKSSRGVSTENASPTPAATDMSNVATPVPSPSATPADKTQLKIQVLNGTGIAGEAGLLTSALKALGYTDITAGNASTQNATDTQVTFASTVSQDVVTEITNKLKDMYTSVTTGNSTLSGFDIQVVTGVRKGQTTQASASPSPSATPAQ